MHIPKEEPVLARLKKYRGENQLLQIACLQKEMTEQETEVTHILRFKFQVLTRKFKRRIKDWASSVVKFLAEAKSNLNEKRRKMTDVHNLDAMQVS